MIDPSTLQAIQSGSFEDPFSLFGLHPLKDGGLRLCTFLPGASGVEAIDAKTGRVVCRLQRQQSSDVFAARAPRRRKPFAYRLRVTWAEAVEEIEDPYRFPPLIGNTDIWLLAEGSHQRPWTVLGAHHVTVDAVAGVRFALWAPNARRVSVVGDFNAWDARRHPLRRRVECGLWEIFLPGLAQGARYKFAILDAEGQALPLKADPYAFHSECPPKTASRIHPVPALREIDAVGLARRNGADRPISIYEVHSGSWRRDPAEPERLLSWEEIADALVPYVTHMGFTHVEFLPVSEHPFDASWGYQPIGLFAPTSRHGTPEGFAGLVDALQKAGIGVLLDWVPGHFPSDAHGLARFDGSHLYEHSDPREGFHPDWNTLIYNFGRREVRNFLISNAFYWLECFGIDGLRVDAVASMLYRDYSRKENEWVANVHGGRENLEAIDLFRTLNTEVATRSPGAIMVAEESTAWPKVSRPAAEGGLGFAFKWNMGWMNDTLRYMARDPIHRSYHQDELTFGLTYAFDESFVLPLSHDEVVHGKGSLIGKMPGARWQRFANLRCYLAFMFGHPGKKLLFMGSELAQEREWCHSDSLDWHLLADPMHGGVQALVRDLNRVYRGVPALYELDCSAAGFQWIAGDDAARSVVAFLRWDRGGSAPVVVVANFLPEPHLNYRLGVPLPGRYQEILNSDSRHYAGGDAGNTGVLQAQDHPFHGFAFSLSLTLPPMSTLWIQAKGEQD